MTKARFISTLCGIGVVQLALIILKATGLVSFGWEVVFIPLEVVATACVLLFLYLVVCVVEDIRNGVFTEGYRDDANGEGGNGKG